MSYVDNDGNEMTYDDLEAVAPLSEIHPGLWQGKGSLLGLGDYKSFDLVVSCERWQRRKPQKEYQGMLIHVPFDDSDDESAVPWGSIETAGEAVAHAVAAGSKVLVHCTAGLNRSSLVTFQALRGLGFETREAIDLIRETRSKWCLCNKTFERLCLEN